MTDPKCCKCESPAEYNIPSNLCSFHWDCWYYMKQLKEGSPIDKQINEAIETGARPPYLTDQVPFYEYSMWLLKPWEWIDWTPEELEEQDNED